MKNRIILLLALAMVFTTTVFAATGNDKVNKNIQTAFAQKFTEAREVNWTITDNFIKASFHQDDQYMSAYYSKEGDLLGVGRNLVLAQLPLNLLKELKKEMSGGWISELFEYTTDEDTTYYATLENADQKLVKKSLDNNSWLIIRKIKKN